MLAHIESTIYLISFIPISFSIIPGNQMILMKNGIKHWNKSNSDLFNHYLMDYIMFHVIYAIRKHYKVFCLFKGWHLHLQNGTKVLIWNKLDLCRLISHKINDRIETVTKQWVSVRCQTQNQTATPLNSFCK